MAEHLTLKWGTLKGWKLESEKSRAIMKRYLDGNVSISAMMQHDTPEQKRLVCNLIDAVEGPIHNDWSGELMSKDAAKAYVMNYGTHITRALEDRK